MPAMFDSLEGSPYYVLDATGEPQHATMRQWLQFGSRLRGIMAVRIDRTQVGRVDVSTIFLSAKGGDDKEWWETRLDGGRFDNLILRRGGSRKNAHLLHMGAIMVAMEAEGPWRIEWHARRAQITDFLNDQLYDWRPAQICARAIQTL